MPSFDVRSLALTVPAVISLAHFVPWLVDPCDIRRYPGPFLAKFSDLWLAYVGKSGQLSETIRKIHEKYGIPFRHVCFQLTVEQQIGTIVRIAPNHVSIVDPEALNTVYGYNGALKSDFYDTFVSSVFSTHDRAEHTRKRKIIAPIFSQKGVLEFEPNLKHHVAQLIRQWDRLFDLARVGMPWKDGQGAIWKGKNNQLFLDLYPCKIHSIYALSN
jgi:benzoate 4-monooxygenase